MTTDNGHVDVLGVETLGFGYEGVGTHNIQGGDAENSFRVQFACLRQVIFFLNQDYLCTYKRKISLNRQLKNLWTFCMIMMMIKTTNFFDLQNTYFTIVHINDRN